MTKTRTELLTELINYSRNPDDVVNELRQFGWDSDQVLCIIRVENIKSVLNQFLARQLNADQVFIWAECLDYLELKFAILSHRHDNHIAFSIPGDEDRLIGFVGKIGFEEQVREAIFILANPDINGGPLSPELARGLNEYLDGKDNLISIIKKQSRRA